MPPRKLLILFLAALLFHCLGNWSLPLIDRDEPRFAEASREMLERGDYVVPYFNGQPRFDKPALIYWMQCASYRLLGTNEFAARLPSALCAALIAVALAVWGARLFDPATGWRAALIFSTCLQVMLHARAAVADMAMVACVLGAAWSGWEWRQARGGEVSPGRGWLLAGVLGLALGFGFLAKGPIALLPLGMLWWGGVPRAAGRLIAQWLAIFGVALLVIAAWGIPALLQTRGEFAAVGLGKHVVARSVVALEGHGSRDLWGYLLMLPFFFATVWVSFFPWSIWLIPTVRSAMTRAAERGSAERYLLSGVILCFGIFTLVRTKLPHYTLPAFPFLALLAAAWWREILMGDRRFRRTVLATGIGGVAAFLLGFPLLAREFPAAQLYLQAAPLLRREMAFGTFDYDEPSLVWTLRRKVSAFREKLDADEVAAWLNRPGPRVLVLPADALAQFGISPERGYRTFLAEGWHFVKGRPIQLALAIRQRPGDD